MSEFNKIKIAFALALLGTLFTLNPIITEYGDKAFKIFGHELSIQIVYFFTLALLSISVYFYAIALISEAKIFNTIQKAGNLSYTISLLIPPLYLGFYTISLIAETILKYANSPAASRIFEFILSGIIGGFASFVAHYLIKLFAFKDRSEKIENLSEEENNLLFRAKNLYDQSFFNSSVLEAWKAIEIGIKKALYHQGLSSETLYGFKLFDFARNKKLLNEFQLTEIMRLMELRNKVVYNEEQVGAKQAQEVLAIVERLLVSLGGIKDQCYYCNK